MMSFLKGRIQQFSILIGLVLFVSSCGILGSDSDEGNVEVRMHDNPVLYQEVNVQIEEVQVKSEGSGSWTTISSSSTEVDVTTLINGEFVTLAETDLEAGSYTQIKLIFGTDNSMKMSGENYNLELSSEVEEGVVMNINMDIDAESSATLLMDFKLNESIIRAAASGEFMLNPSIEVRRAKQTGSIAGSINPVKAKPWVYALHNSDTVSSTIADTSSGEFKLNSLDEQSYDIYVEPTNDSYKDTTVTNVDVEARETNDIGELKLSEVDSSGSGNPL
jgi:hypothetical protein